MNKVLSIVIPSYNCENYLDKCVNSLISSDVIDKIEIIIVNDGSIDRTEEIALNYEMKYQNSVRVISQENKGHGGALNTGLSNTTGKYVKVIDADDWVETENLPLFIEKLEKVDADVILTHHYTIDISNGEVKKWKCYPPEFEKAYNFKEIMPEWKNFDRSLTFHGITYNRDFYIKNYLPLCEKVFYEDHEYATYPCCLAKKIVPLDMFIYNYRIGDVSQSVSDDNQLKRIGHIETVINCILDKYSKLALPKCCKGREYIAMKLQGVLMSYITTCLLVEKNKKSGRTLAKNMMNRIKTQLPLAYQHSINQYKVFLFMNYLSISKKTWTKIVTSKFYRFIRGNHDFS